MSRHLKAYAAPKSWTILRKVNKWIVKPSPGAHPLKSSLPVGLLLKQLGHAHTSREAKKILNQGVVLVDGKKVFDVHRSVGFMDVVQVGDSALRCGLDKKGRLTFTDAKADLGMKVCRVVGKQSVVGGKTQITLSDGRNLLSGEKVAVGDSLVIELPGQKVSQHLSLDKGVSVFLMAGRHTGVLSVVQKIDGAKITCKSGDEVFETLREFAFVVGKDKPVVKLQ
ncbi:hypothetical protein HY489_00075 [Candidatus Woesearchaeota archaeon]|nr:hypothetical protein [Candidatus Woesearchaeota archaeon]